MTLYFVQHPFVDFSYLVLMSFSQDIYRDF